MKIRIVTPEGLLLDTDAELVELPGLSGQLGILPGHTPLVVGIGSGELRVDDGEVVTGYVVAGGFAEITPDHVNVLTVFAGEDVEAQGIEEACARARRALEDSGAMSSELIDAELSALKSSMVHLAERGRHRRRRG